MPATAEPVAPDAPGTGPTARPSALPTDARPADAIPGTPRGDEPDAPSGDVRTLPLRAEALGVSRRVRRTSVRAARTTRLHEAVVEEDLARTEVCVRRVPVGRVVEAAPPVREEGDLVIIPVLEEVLVVERRLVLVEEVHLRRTRSTQRHVETVQLRRQDVVVTRVPLAD